MKPRALDLFCGAGGASMGLSRAGFDVVGCDIKYFKNYPFHQIVCDVMAVMQVVDLSAFDLIWASPPCQRFSVATPEWNRENHPDLIEPVRELLENSGALYAIENVQKAPIRADIILDGVKFGLPLERRRIFEVNFPTNNILVGPNVRPASGLKVGPASQALTGPALDRENGPSAGAHSGLPQAVYVSGGSGAGKGSLDDWKRAMGIDWMTRREITEAIPPVYAQAIGECALEHIDMRRAAE